MGWLGRCGVSGGVLREHFEDAVLCFQLGLKLFLHGEDSIVGFGKEVQLLFD